MKEIKAYLHRHRVADVVHALENAGFRNLCIIDVKGLLRAVDASEQDYSLELGGPTITEARLEMMCEDRHLGLAIRLIEEHGRTGQPEAGWIFVSEISDAFPIGGSSHYPG